MPHMISNFLDVILRHWFHPLIAVMGGTGSGKSSFINSVIERDVAPVGHSLDSQTSEIKEYSVTLSKRRFILVDTPGFDDYRGETGNVADIEILEMLGKFLLDKYQANRKFTAIIYIHNISEPRVGNVSHTHMEMFKALCGTESMSNVIVVTTFWDRLHSAEEGIARENELKNFEGFLKQLHDNGALFKRVGKQNTARRLTEDYASTMPREIISQFFPPRKVFVAMQKELEKSGNVAATAAGKALQSLYGSQSEENMKKLEDLNRELQALQGGNASEKDDVLFDAMADLKEMKKELEYWQKKEARLRETAMIRKRPSKLLKTSQKVT